MVEKLKMPRMFVSFRIGKFDKKKYSAAVLRVLEGELRLAVAAFIRAAMSHVPVQTGMARGSFLNVAKYIRTQLLQRVRTIGPEATSEAAELTSMMNFTTNPVRVRMRRKTLKNGGSKQYIYMEKIKWYYHPDGRRMPKTPESGAKLSSGGKEAFSNLGLRLRFTFNSRVYHFNLNEFYDAGSYTAPWNALERGRAAFVASLSKSLKKLPEIKNFISHSTVTAGPGNFLKVEKHELPNSTLDARVQ